MAIFRLEAKIFSREKRGRSVIAAAAYRAGSKLKDELRDKIFDYTRRSKGVIETTILTPENAPAWASNSGELWNTVERSEKRVDAQLAREFVLALPKELSAKEQFDCAVGWAKKELVSQGMIVEVSLHHPKDGKNPHCHLLCTLRTVEGDKFSAKKPREWNDVGMLVKQRETWADACNAALEKAGRDERVDHRSLKDQGIERLPEPKIGVVATAMKRRGVLWDSERFRAVREVKMFNEVLNMMKSIKQHGKVQQHGIGPDWWHTSPLLSNVRDRAKKAFKRTWQRLVKPHQPQANKDGKNKDGFEPSV